MANKGRPGELGLGTLGNVDDNNQDNMNNPKYVNNQGNPNNGGNVNNQGIPPIIPARPVRDVAIPLTANLASSIRKPPPGDRFELKQSMAVNWCEVCGSGTHETEQCEANPDFVNYVGNAQRGGVQQNYGNTYNPSWRNHPNFSWGGNQNQNQAQGANQYHAQGAGQQYQNPNQGVNPSSPKGGMTNEELLQKLMLEIGTKLNARVDKQDENIRNIQMSPMSLEKQVAQVANSLNLHPQGGLPGDTEPNPK
ncbi:hypothetical protein KY290_010657 [Solanum tuberosum]|uniref:Integrase core domain containing protein n=1 Tax=Solanum tuberosum TaxID=4113 RepID=A0ABQ7W0G0_SOLTU|nr:hypothetical protein KY290_010657 [Solanum tuberosum]